MNRIVTGHASTSTPGKEPAVKILINGEPNYTLYDAGSRIAQLWQTHGHPTHVQGEKDETEGVDPNTIVVEDGSNIRWGEIQPGGTVPLHRTSSVDYAIVTHGTLTLVTPKAEIDLTDVPYDLLNDSRLEYTEAKQGDVIVQRGTMHAWVNRGDVPVRFVGVLLAAEPFKTEGGHVASPGFWAKQSAN